MDIVTLKWVAGVLLLPGLSFAVIVLWLLKDIKRTSDAGLAEIVKLTKMHYEANKYSFGTGELTAYAKDQGGAIKDLVHYIKWQAKEITGKEPPPRISGDP